MNLFLSGLISLDFFSINIFFLFLAHYFIDNVVYIECFPSDQLLQSDFMAFSRRQHCCSTLDEKNKVIANRAQWRLGRTMLISIIFLYDYRPDLPRPIRVNTAIPIIFIILCVVLVMLPSLEAPQNLLIGVLIILAGVPVYYLGVCWKNKPASYNAASRSVEYFCQIMFATIFVDDEEKSV